jgi:hypothetical protein
MTNRNGGCWSGLSRQLLTMTLGVVALLLSGAPVFAQGWTYQGTDGQRVQVQRNAAGSGYYVTGNGAYQGTVTRDNGMQNEDIQQLLRRR